MTCHRVAGARMAWILIAGVLLLAQAGRFAGAASRAKNERAAREHWAFHPVRRPVPPAVRDATWVQTPVDAFVLARLEKEGLRPAPPADRRTLLRRVYLDLIGLPPTPEEQRAFLEDPSPEAYRKVVDDLLSRPQYGERWARHWLDVVRYAESNGYERDGAKPSAWRYRDYVIDAFNRDKPYDRFVVEQVAGDEVADGSAETQIATTCLRLGTWDDEPADPLVDRYDQLDDVLGTTAAAFLGVTLRCARCHDHKFEPFTQVDYYRMLAVFEPLKRPQNGREDLDRPVGTAAELATYRQRREQAAAEIAAVRKQVDTLNRKVLDRLATAPAPKPKPGAPQAGILATAVEAFKTQPGKQTKPQKDLLKKFNIKLEETVRKGSTPEETALRQRLEKQIAAIEAARIRELPNAYIWYENGPKAPATYVLHRGSPAHPRQEVAPGVPAVLVHDQPEPPSATTNSTGRRLWLAQWMARPDNPLVARVMVNRIWQHHFGRGLVGTPNDFGVMGERPSHPELLDWLASEFVAGGWRLKPLHRLIVLSRTYQMSSATTTPAPPDAARVDPRGVLLASWPQRRLEAEAVRDSMLAVSGRLNRQMAGPSVYPPLPRAVLEGQSRPGEGWGKSDERQSSRRSLYIFVKRVLQVPELELLDAPDTNSSCEQRTISTTAPQALTFLNGEFVREQARAFAIRLEREAGHDAEAKLRRAFELAWCRPPRGEEVPLALKFLAAQERQIESDARARKKDAGNARLQALEAFCLVMLNTNEFVYAD